MYREPLKIIPEFFADVRQYEHTGFNAKGCSLSKNRIYFYRALH